MLLPIIFLTGLCPPAKRLSVALGIGLHATDAGVRLSGLAERPALRGAQTSFAAGAAAAARPVIETGRAAAGTS